MELAIKKSEEKDWEFIRRLRNECSDGFFSDEQITPEQHKRFMQKYGENHLIAFNCDNERLGDSLVTLMGTLGLPYVQSIEKKE